VFKDAKEYAKSCDVCQRTGRPSKRDEFPLHLVVALQAFDKWEVDFIKPINPPARHYRARYIIIATYLLPHPVGRGSTNQGLQHGHVRKIHIG